MTAQADTRPEDGDNLAPLASDAPMTTRNYPLPWCEAADEPYCELNYQLCGHLNGWREWQRGKPMGEIIPHIDRLYQRFLAESSGGGQPMSDEDTAELNAILERMGATKRYRSDGTKYDAT